MSSLPSYDPSVYSSSNDGDGVRDWNFADFEERAVAYLVVKGGQKRLGAKGNSKARSDKVRDEGGLWGEGVVVGGWCLAAVVVVAIPIFIPYPLTAFSTLNTRYCKRSFEARVCITPKAARTDPGGIERLGKYAPTSIGWSCSPAGTL
jgi:hypothetical protein